PDRLLVGEVDRPFDRLDTAGARLDLRAGIIRFRAVVREEAEARRLLEQIAVRIAKRRDRLARGRIGGQAARRLRRDVELRARSDAGDTDGRVNLQHLGHTASSIYLRVRGHGTPG